MDIILFSGQSNMQGQTESLPYTKYVRGAYEYKWLKDKTEPLRHPVGEDYGELLLAAHEGHGSLVPAFCRAYVRETKRKVLAVHAAKGATTVAEWLPEHPSGRYAALVQKAQGALKIAGKKDRFAIVWLQGESDALEGVSQETYSTRLERLRDCLQNDLNQDVFSIIRVGRFACDERDIPILKAQEALCAEGKFLMLTRFTGYCTEKPDQYINPFACGHYNNRAMEIIGETAGKNLAKYYAGEKIELEKEPYGFLTEE